MNYYNEHDKKAAAWLRVLASPALEVINPGTVDDGDVQDVTAADLEGMTQCHFFAGIGGWAHALDLAGFPRSRPVFTASLPCQPFSSAGQQKGKNDERHLWPHFRDLVEQCRPHLIFGEQVSSKLAVGESTYVSPKKSVEHLLDEAGRNIEEESQRSWFATVQADLEDLGYVVAASDLPAAGVGAPHIRQRLYWCAVRWEGELPGAGSAGVPEVVEERFGAGGLAYLETGRRGQVHSICGRCGEGSGAQGSERLEHCGSAGGLEYPDVSGWERPALCPQDEQSKRAGGIGRASDDGGWNDVIYLPCADGKARPIKPGIEPLVNGVPPDLGLGSDHSQPYSVGDVNTSEARVMRLRGYGNAIAPELAAVFIRSVMETLDL